MGVYWLLTGSCDYLVLQCDGMTSSSEAIKPEFNEALIDKLVQINK